MIREGHSVYYIHYYRNKIVKEENVLASKVGKNYFYLENNDQPFHIRIKERGGYAGKNNTSSDNERFVYLSEQKYLDQIKKQQYLAVINNKLQDKRVTDNLGFNSIKIIMLALGQEL